MCVHVCACVCMNACAAVPAPAMPPSSKAGGSRCPRGNLSVYLSTGAKNKNEHNNDPIRRRAVCGRGEGPSDSSLGVLAQKKNQEQNGHRARVGGRSRAGREAVCVCTGVGEWRYQTPRAAICMCVYMCVCICVCIYTQTHTYIYMYTYVCLRVYMYVYSYM